jgi:ribosomal protein L37AE/L43A
MYDEELLNLAADAQDLTETARHVLELEIKKRQLNEPADETGVRPSPEPRPERRAPLVGNQGGAPQLILDPPEEFEAHSGPHEYTWKTILCACESPEQGQQLTAALKRAGVDCWVEQPGAGFRYGTFDGPNPRILVAADQLEQARAIAAQPIPADIVEESRPVEVSEYELPVCPHCGAEDPALEGVDPFNSWRCDSCGFQWTESGEDEAKEQAKYSK